MSVVISAFILVTAPKPFQLGIFPHDISVYTTGELIIVIIITNHKINLLKADC